MQVGVQVSPPSEVTTLNSTDCPMKCFVCNILGGQPKPWANKRFVVFQQHFSNGASNDGHIMIVQTCHSSLVAFCCTSNKLTFIGHYVASLFETWHITIFCYITRPSLPKSLTSSH